MIIRAIVSLAVMCALLSGCMFHRLQRDLERIGSFASIEGRASSGGDVEPIIVVLYRQDTKAVVDFFVLARAGRYFFVAPPGTYRIAAFEDRNRDFTYQAGIEPAATYGSPTDVVLGAGTRLENADLSIAPKGRTQIPLAIGPLDPHRRGIEELPDVQLGTVVDLGDPRFSDENGKLGLWQPAEFVFKVGAGVYFLEPYDPKKIPVLFVHGVTGHPGNWKYLATHLDRGRFQPWFVYYPSGLGLSDLGRVVVRWMSVLQVQYGFSKLVVVAHSMGGLVARAALNHALEDAPVQRPVRLDALVTISTPWGGHASAAGGVEHAPVVVPSWKDVVPGSAFLSALTARDLPPECEHHVFFSYQGSTPFIREASDGVVAVSSELPLVVQRRAKQVLGFNEDHMSILQSSEVSTELNAILSSVAGG